MTNKVPAQSCKHCPSMVCFSIDTCQFTSVEECLKQALFLAQRELASMKEKSNLKHSRMSLKWRDSSFYYKKRSKQLEKFIHKSGLEIPLTYPGKVEENEGLDNSSQDELPSTSRDDSGSPQREVGHSTS